VTFGKMQHLHLRSSVVVVPCKTLASSPCVCAALMPNNLIKVPASHQNLSSKGIQDTSISGRLLVVVVPLFFSKRTLHHSHSRHCMTTGTRKSVGDACSDCRSKEALIAKSIRMLTRSLITSFCFTSTIYEGVCVS